MARRQLLWISVVFATFVLAGCVLLATAAVAQETATKDKAAQVVNETSKKGTPGAADPNIKQDSEKNDPNAKSAPPPEKGGPKTRGAGPYRCGIHVDNRTPYFVRTYVDGDYVGTVNRYGDIAGITGNGPTSLYAVAVFDDGSTSTWGPHIFNCAPGDTYSWRLR